MRHRHFIACLAAALTLGTALQAAPPMAPSASLAPMDQLVLVGGGTGNNDGIGGDINRARERENRRAVRSSTSLERAAQDYAERMRQQGFFSHTAPNGSTPQDRAQAADCNCVAVAENIAKGYRNADQVFRAWMDSDGHRRNILGRDYDSFGLGRSGDVWVLMFSD